MRRLGDHLALGDAVDRFRRDVVSEDGDRVVADLRPAVGGLKPAGGFRRDHRTEAHLVRRGPDEVEAFRVRLQKVLGALDALLAVPVAAHVLPTI